MAGYRSLFLLALLSLCRLVLSLPTNLEEPSKTLEARAPSDVLDNTIIAAAAMSNAKVSGFGGSPGNEGQCDLSKAQLPSSKYCVRS